MTGKRRRRWYQYRLRTLLLLTTLTALVLSYVAWWQSTRKQRALQRAIRECDDSMSEEEKELLCSLVWQREARELLEHRLGSFIWEDEPMQWDLRLGISLHIRGRLTWHTTFLDIENRPRRVFLFGGGGGFGTNSGTVVLTDDRYRLIQWKKVGVGGRFKSAALKPSGGAVELSIIADTLGLTAYHRRGTYRFLLDDNGIIDHGVEWDEVSHGDSKRKTSTP